MAGQRASNEVVIGRLIAELDVRISTERDMLFRLHLIQRRVSLRDDLRALHRAKCTTVGAGYRGEGATVDAARQEAHA